MKALSIIGIIVSVFTPIFVAAGLNEIYCSSFGSGDSYAYSYIAGDGIEITLLVTVLVSLFFLAFSIIGLIYANKMSRKLKEFNQ